MKSVIEEEDFLEYYEQLETSNRMNNAARFIFNYLKENPMGQLGPIFVKFPSFVRGDVIEILETYGVFSSLKVPDTSRRNYIIMIDDEFQDFDSISEESLASIVDSYIKEKLPEGVTPSFYCTINLVINSRATHDRILGIMSKRFPRISPLYDYYSFSLERIDSQDLEEFLGEISSYDKIDVSGHISLLEEKMKSGNFFDLLGIIYSIEKDLLIEAGRHSNPIFYVHQGVKDLVGIDAAIAAYMYLKHGIVTHLSKGAQSLFNKYLSTVSFGKRTQTAFDQLEFIKQLPNFSLYQASETSMCYVIVKDLASRVCKVKVHSVSLEACNQFLDSVKDWSEDTIEKLKKTVPVETSILNIDDLEVVDLFDLFPFTKAQWKESHSYILKLFILLDALNVIPEITDVTSVFFLSTEEGLKVCVREYYDIQIPSLVFPLEEGMTSFDLVLTESRFSQLKEISSLPNYEKVLSEIITSLASSHLNMGGTIPYAFNTSLYKFKREIGIFLDNFSYFNHKRLSLENCEDYVTVGLFWRETYLYRSTMLDHLQNYLDLKKIRRTSSFLSIFGGPFELTYQNSSRSLRISEDFIIGG